MLTMLSIYILLAYLYCKSISPAYSYMGFVTRSLSSVEWAVSIIFFIIPVMILPVYPMRPSDLTIWALYLFSYAPTALLSIHILDQGITDIMTLLLILLVAFLLFFYSRIHSVNLSPKITINFERLDILVLALLFTQGPSEWEAVFYLRPTGGGVRLSQHQAQHVRGEYE